MRRRCLCMCILPLSRATFNCSSEFILLVRRSGLASVGKRKDGLQCGLRQSGRMQNGRTWLRVFFSLGFVASVRDHDFAILL